MEKLFSFLYSIRYFLLFALLEGFALSLLIKRNNYQSAGYFNTHRAYVAGIHTMRQSTGAYLDLYKTNKELAEENARLQSELVNIRYRQVPDSLKSEFISSDSAKIIACLLVKNDVFSTRNYFTINKGSLDGVRPNMGVITPQGVFGEIKFVEKHYSTGVSLLHTKNSISAQIKGSKALGIIEWDASSAREADLTYVGRYYPVNEGDTVVTSGFNATFPYGVPIGKIIKVDGDNQTYYRLRLRLFTDFNASRHLYVVDRPFAKELDSLAKKEMEHRKLIR